MNYREGQQAAKAKLSRRRYLYGEGADGSKLFIGSPGVTLNMGRNKMKRELRKVKKALRSRQ